MRNPAHLKLLNLFPLDLPNHKNAVSKLPEAMATLDSDELRGNPVPLERLPIHYDNGRCTYSGEASDQAVER